MKRQIFRLLNRPGFRGVLGLIASVIKSVRYRRLIRVRYENGQWIHTHPDGILVERGVHLAKVSDLDAMTRDYWFHAYTPRDGDVVVDVGAGTGWEARLCSGLVGPRGRVIAIEAHPDTFACLKEMVARNGLTNITPIHCAVSRNNGWVTISDDANHQGNRLVSGSGVQVPARTLDQILSDEGVGRVSLLKMNIEGAEAEALSSLGRSAKLVEHFAVSCHDFLADWGYGEELRTRADVLGWMTDVGLEIRLREDARPWARDYLYASQSLAKAGLAKEN